MVAVIFYDTISLIWLIFFYFRVIRPRSSILFIHLLAFFVELQKVIKSVEMCE